MLRSPLSISRLPPAVAGAAGSAATGCGPDQRTLGSVHQFLPTEAGDVAPGLCYQERGCRRIVEQTGDGAGNCRTVIERYEQSIAAMVDHLRVTTNAGGDDGRAGGHCLQHDVRQSLVAGVEDEDVGSAEVA